MELTAAPTLGSLRLEWKGEEEGKDGREKVMKLFSDVQASFKEESDRREVRTG